MSSALRKIIKKGRQTEFIWRYGFNFNSWIEYKFAPSKPSQTESERVSADLEQNGVAVTTVDQLLGQTALFRKLDSRVKQILSERSAEIDQLRNGAGDSESIGKKTFNVELLGSKPEFSEAEIPAKFALQEAFLDIADRYFGMRVKLRYYNVWLTFATDAKARESQLWHFDREDNFILKAFVYLNDVSENTGPFTYAPGTHRKGKFRDVVPEYFSENGVQRSTDEQMRSVFPEDRWFRGTGPKGTIIFADTRGFHKGGMARDNDRLMFTCMYTSPASDSERLIKFDHDLSTRSLTDRQRSALEIN
ncbi:MAG: phytanoyl-CoA dioxygenase family protein [Pyrinomonadaceae bacterium]|nr:phytanoyl-CoA dioxygenase family protein [Pyrinomonadaceae bacterium]